jgi:tetratricopeptide (TPR) repeat protein
VNGLRASAVGILVCCCVGCSGSDGRESLSADSDGTPSGSGATADLASDGVADPIAEAEDLPTEEDLERLRAAVAARPTDTPTVRALAVALYELKRSEEVIALFERTAELDPGVTTYLDLALAYSKRGLWTEAEQTYAKLLALDPGHAIAKHNLGNIAFNRGDTEGAIRLFQEALRLDPRYLLAYAHLADALERAGMYREAYVTYNQVLELDPKSPAELKAFDGALYSMASLDIAMGAYDRAAVMLEELIRHSPDHPAAHYALGQTLLRLGRQQEAQQHFETHMQILARQKSDSAVASEE